MTWKATVMAVCAFGAATSAFWLDWRAALLMAAAGAIDRMFARGLRDSDTHRQAETRRGSVHDSAGPVGHRP